MKLSPLLRLPALVYTYQAEALDPSNLLRRYLVAEDELYV